jgi:solute carrier family 10 (sodium/bile acid cotransporter), member 7
MKILKLVRVKMDWFLCGMICAVMLAWLFPGPGAKGGWLYPELLTKAGIALIFFLHGLLLAFSSLKEGVKRWKLHLIVQATTFIFFPLIGLAVFFWENELFPADMRLGFFFLCALPSTVSSSVALTAAAKGNVAAAVFNATVSSLIGIFVTPLWLMLVTHEEQVIPYADVIVDLLQWLLLPLTLGQMARPWLKSWAQNHKPLVSKIDRGTILLLVYTSFCDSVVWGVWNDRDMGLLATIGIALVVLLVTMLFFTQMLCRIMHLPWADTVTAIFCGSKKSLAQGVPMAQLIFAGNPALGMILLPIMLYHPIQLFICGALAGRWAKRKTLYQ